MLFRSIRDFYSPNALWEGQFIDIFGNNLKQKITICNIYRPPRDRNDHIESFINDISPILSTLSQERSDKLFVGDFNIDLLKANIREKYSDFLNVMMNNDFMPKITLPTRFSERNATLIDNVFCSLTRSNKVCLSGIIFTNLSDHLPYFTCLDQKINLQAPPKYVQIETKDPVSIQNFIQDINNTNFMQALDNDLNCDPNHNYDKLINIIHHFKNKHLPTKTIRFNKYKHKKSPWITNGILRSIKFRDNLYKQMKSTHPDSQQFPTLKQNLKTYNKILNRSIQQSKRNHYHSQLDRKSVV